MIRMGMRNYARIYVAELEFFPKRVQVGVSRKIDEQPVIYQSLAAGTDIPSSPFPGMLAYFALAKRRRNRLCRGSSKILQLYATSPSLIS